MYARWFAEVGWSRQIFCLGWHYVEQIQSTIDISSSPGIEESDICRVVLTPLVPKEEMAYTVSELMTSRHYSRTGPCQMK